ncbi:uncharacterized protein TRIADDRAFT_11569, partial [Trichoplax adhaerens]
GWGCFHPQYIQLFNSQKWLMAFIGIYIFISGIQTTGLGGVVITSLETRYELRSAETGLFTSSYEVAAAICGLVISYYAGQRHKGKFIATGSVMAGLGAVAFVSPHFFSGKYSPINSEITSNLCFESLNKSIASNTSSVCNSYIASSARNYLYIFIAAQVIIGTGNNLMWNVGMAYVDENVDPVASSVYIGIMVTLSAIGPAIGYLLGGLLLNLWVDWPDPSDGVAPDDPRWVGAWWLGFLACGTGMLIISIPLYGYPPYLPNYAVFKAKRLAMAKGKSKVDKEYGTSIKDLPLATKELFMNLPCTFSILAATCEATTATGFAVFLPKFIQSQFGLTSSTASLIAGSIVVPGAGGGMLAGGFIMRYYKLDGLAAAKLNVIFSGLATISVLCFALSCGNVPFSTVGLDRSENSATVCNYQCKCYDSFEPLCGSDKITYYSPCFAGCTEINRNQTFSNCSCMATVSNISSLSKFNTSQHGNSGICPLECNNMIPFLATLFVLMIFTFLKTVPTQQVLLRCVPESQRSFSLGVQWLFLRLLGNVPGPIIMGSIIDRSCILWSVTCNQRNNCWLYNNQQMSRLILILGITFKISTTIFYLIAWHYYK